MKILIIEDEKRLAGILKKGLEESAFAVDLSFDGEEGLYMAETFNYDAIILDILLPKMDGLSILNTLRKKNINVPVILLTAKGEVECKVKGLNTGADDYVPKPFDFLELLARLKAVIRRDKGKPSPVIQIGNLIIDTNARTVKRGDQDILLSTKEYSLLEYLVLHKDKVLTRSELIEHVYDSESDRDSNVIDVYINYLRNKIDKGFEKPLIHTVRGTGYILKETN